MTKMRFAEAEEASVKCDFEGKCKPDEKCDFEGKGWWKKHCQEKYSPKYCGFSNQSAWNEGQSKCKR